MRRQGREIGRFDEYTKIKSLTVEINNALRENEQPFLENPTNETLEELLQSMPLKEYERNKFARVILFTLIDQRISNLTSSDSVTESLRQKLHDTLIKDLDMDALPTSHKKVLQVINQFKGRLDPFIKSGKASQAKKLANLRQEKIRSYAKKIVSLGETQNLDDLNAYINFLKQVQTDRNLTLEKFNTFKSLLHSPSNLPLLRKQTSVITREIRSIKNMTAFMVADEWLNTGNKLSEEERKQIKIIYSLVNSQEEATEEALAEMQSSVQASYAVEIARKARQVSSIIKRIALNRGNVSKDFQDLSDAIARPFAKILNDPELNELQKAASITAKIGTKTLQAGGKIASAATHVGLVTTKNAIKKPVMTVMKLGASSANAFEIFKLYQLQAKERDPEKKADITKKIKEERLNLSYNSRKMLEALLLSAASYIAISSLIASSGTLAPAMLVGPNEALEALISAHGMEATHIVDSIKTSAELLAQLSQSIIESDVRGVERKILIKSIEETLAEIISLAPNIGTEEFFLEAFDDMVQEDKDIGFIGEVDLDEVDLDEDETETESLSLDDEDIATHESISLDDEDVSSKDISLDDEEATSEDISLDDEDSEEHTRKLKP